MNRINQFLNALDLQSMGKVGSHVRPHKPVLLAVLDLIARHGANRFKPNEALAGHFEAGFKRGQSGSAPCMPPVRRPSCGPFVWSLKKR